MFPEYDVFNMEEEYLSRHRLRCVHIKNIQHETTNPEN